MKILIDGKEVTGEKIEIIFDNEIIFSEFGYSFEQYPNGTKTLRGDIHLIINDDGLRIKTMLDGVRYKRRCMDLNDLVELT